VTCLAKLLLAAGSVASRATEERPASINLNFAVSLYVIVKLASVVRVDQELVLAVEAILL